MTKLKIENDKSNKGKKIKSELVRTKYLLEIMTSDKQKEKQTMSEVIKPAGTYIPATLEPYLLLYRTY